MKSDGKEIKLPEHIAFIMDGNGRWAQKRLLPRKAGHKKGVDALEALVGDIFDMGIPYVSVYAFSTENRDRPKDEIDALFALIRDYFVKVIDKFVDNEIKVRFMGDTDYFPEDLRLILQSAEKRCAGFDKKVFNIGLNYGSKAEILRAVNLAVKNGVPVTEESFEKLLYTNGMPSPDIIVRTGGEKRLSNFMLYQAAYSELFFTDTLWPDFDKKKLLEILEEYSKRNRKFGKIQK